MSANRQLKEKFEQIADMQALMGEDSFRVSGNARVARAIGDLSENIEDLAEDRKKLIAIDGVGERAADKISEFLDTGDITEHKELLAKVPAGLLEILKVPGIGPKSVRAMWKDKGVESLDDLKRIIDSGEILDVPRMGKKTVENMKQAITFTEQSGGRTPLGVAMPIAEVLVERMSDVRGVKRVEYAGSLRRGKDTIGDVDILVAANSGKSAAKTFQTMPEVTQVLAAGETKSSVRLKVEDDQGRFHTIQADLRIVPPDAFGAALMYFTGSKEHNVRLRERAIKMGFTLNEYGLFPHDDEDSPPQSRGVKPVAAETEHAIYERLDLPLIPPELREDRGEMQAPAERFDNLLTLDDIKSELHAHTTASDGAMSIEQLAEAAKDRGFHTIAVTDHSKSQAVANGLDEKRLEQHIEAVHAADNKVKGIKILAGSEVDILTGGKLDYSNDLLEQLDIVVASPHFALKQSPKQATKRLLAAIEHPLVHIIGHATGRLIGRREGLAPDMTAIVDAAAEHDTALEINAHWLRLDLRDTHVRAAVDAGARIAIDCDVHTRSDFDNLRFGVLTGRRGWLPRKQCVNALSKKALHDWLKSKRS